MATTEGAPGDRWAQLRVGLAADVRRVAERFRGLSEARLLAELPPHGSRAAAGRHAVRVLADAAQGLDARDAPTEPTWRPVPELSPFAVGDQVAVTGQDLLAALDAVGPEEAVWGPGGRRTARDLVTDAAETLAALRRLL
ncbi:MAG: hypothetical protein ACRDV1_12630 [Actinomycetes bacterium]